jgi:thioredoxin reductase (NADPH)
VRVLRDARALRVEGDDRVSGVTIAIGDREETLAARGVFVCAGAAPRTALVDGVVELGPAGGVVTDGARTSVPGIYAIGDVRAGASQRLDAITADVDALVEALA